MAVGAVALAAVLIAYRDALMNMHEDWQRAEYSHGYLIPLLALYMAVQADWAAPGSGPGRDRTRWLGVLAVAAAVALLAAGALSTLYIVSQYAFLLAVGGIVLSLVGLRTALSFWAPLLFLLFMVPLPNFIYFNLSNSLQLISSELGVMFIRALGITVFLEGNVIDLGIYKLQVAEACSGLRYLFPLMSFGFLCAFLYRGPFWKKVVLFTSTIPIAILLNSLRIGIIGVLVDYQGIEAAEGFVHLFEGWVVFIACLLILFGEAVLLHRIGSKVGSLRDSFALDLSRARIVRMKRLAEGDHKPLMAATGVLVLAAVASLFVGGRAEAVPQRSSFSLLPLQIGEWRGQDQALPPEIVQALQLDDYANVNFVNPGDGATLNFYAAYYASQRQGASAHSPRSCIPGGGWEIEGFSTIRIGNVGADPAGMTVNRAIISKGTSRQLVYYWFQQRGRVVANEYLVKWYLLVDALTRHRTDGAMIRLVTPIGSAADVARADAVLAGFMREIAPRLNAYIPE
jgi:exosortase D (VPLPA-CTERM-specific)